MTPTDRTEHDIERLVDALGDATRRRAFLSVRRSGSAVSKADVAAELGIGTRLAGFHLDKLVAEGFLDADFRRPEGRSGPGAGRPAKRYRPSDTPVAVAFPERHYDVLASLLLRAMARTDGASDGEALQAVGYEFGFQMGLAELASGASLPEPGAVRDQLADLLSRLGYSAVAEGESSIRACSCPFEELAFEDPSRVCTLDRAVWRGMLAAFSSDAELRDTTARAEGDDACVATVA